ncbi:uncharacterized protein LOC132187876 [Corylus avellana]|uniref:uncharacterized protein LOC132187876 n=1 Tax=Corylus avellana TaxID=13451 RepID=UPI00286D29BA|nr:uncharacterized protein LOC132187876 [Corylus avellana]
MCAIVARQLWLQRNMVVYGASAWRKPHVDYIKVNWDASLNARKSRVGIGVVARDHAGRVVAVLSDSEVATTDPEGAETLATCYATDMCHYLGLRNVILEGDALMVVRSLQKGKCHWGRLRHVLNDTTQKLQTMQEWRVDHIPQEANVVAHRIATLALSIPDRQIWVEGPTFKL